MPRRPVRIDEKSGFPDPRGAVVGGPYDGLVAIGGDLGIDRLRLAYRSGMFPWTVNPVTWWSPDPRGIFELGGIHVSRSLRRCLRQGKFRVTRDQAFDAVITGCAAVRRPGGWIVPEFIKAYTALHREGHAHSVECWLGEDLVGGVYGVSVGGLFAGESMFHRASDASKVAVVHLHDHLVSRGYALFDIQMLTEATTSLGACEIRREDYLARLNRAVDLPVRFD